jgi:oligopeptide/dipeptide ABC transporter ATP-binding protein
MYAGRIVESATAEALFETPSHPYTRALLKSVPRVEQKRQRLVSIEGLPPRLDRGPFEACTFAPRCPDVLKACRDGEPGLTRVSNHQQRRCIVPVADLS